MSSKFNRKKSKIDRTNKLANHCIKMIAKEQRLQYEFNLKMECAEKLYDRLWDLLYPEEREASNNPITWIYHQEKMRHGWEKNKHKITQWYRDNFPDLVKAYEDYENFMYNNFDTNSGAELRDDLKAEAQGKAPIKKYIIHMI